MKANTEKIYKLMQKKKITFEELGKRLRYKINHRQAAWQAIRGFKRLDEIGRILGFTDGKPLIK